MVVDTALRQKEEETRMIEEKMRQAEEEARKVEEARKQAEEERKKYEAEKAQNDAAVSDYCIHISDSIHCLIIVIVHCRLLRQKKWKNVPRRWLKRQR